MPQAKRTALITGAGRNIGRAIALALARDGFNIVANGSKNREACAAVAREAEAAGVSALVVMGDVGNAADCQRIAAEALAKFGTVDVLINNAAVRPHGGFLELADADWERVMAVDFYAAVRLSRAVLPGMIGKGWGRIVNFSGMNAMQGHLGRPHVAAAKHAALGLTKALAKEFASKGITANMISPGIIQSERDDPAMRERVLKEVAHVAAQRQGKAEEIAAVVAMLASDGGGYVNGQLIPVNGAGTV